MGRTNNTPKPAEVWRSHFGEPFERHAIAVHADLPPSTVRAGRLVIQLSGFDVGQHCGQAEVRDFQLEALRRVRKQEVFRLEVTYTKGRGPAEA